MIVPGEDNKITYFATLAYMTSVNQITRYRKAGEPLTPRGREIIGYLIRDLQAALAEPEQSAENRRAA